MESFGDKLYLKISNSKNQLFLQGEMAQLTAISYQQFMEWINNQEKDTIPISTPIGYNSDNTPMMSVPRDYSKDELKDRYSFLGLTKLPVDGIFQLVTITETMLNDILRLIMIEYPKKIPNKKKIDVGNILLCDSIEKAKLNIVDDILNELTYKSPKDYAEEFNKYSGVNLFENPVFHNYIELKATRDVHIHNNGNANETYTSKAGVLARSKPDHFLPVTLQYFLQMYEQCLQLTEVLEKELNDIWPSEEYKNRKQASINKNQELSVEKTIEDSKNIIDE